MIYGFSKAALANMFCDFLMFAGDVLLLCVGVGLGGLVGRFAGQFCRHWLLSVVTWCPGEGPSRQNQQYFER